MQQEELEVNIRFSNLYSTLLKVDTKNVSLNDLYKSKNFKQWLNKPDFGLYLWSNSPGSGKTTTAIKLSQELVSKGYKVLALSLIDYKNELKKTFGKPNKDGGKNFYDRLYKYDYIFIDDISYSVIGDWALEVLKDLLDKCYNNKGPILILTSQVEVNNLPFPNAFKSRILGMCKVIHFREQDLRPNYQNDFKF